MDEALTELDEVFEEGHLTSFFRLGHRNRSEDFRLAACSHEGRLRSGAAWCDQAFRLPASSWRFRGERRRHRSVVRRSLHWWLLRFAKFPENERWIRLPG